VTRAPILKSFSRIVAACVRLYADTPESRDAKTFASRLKQRMEKGYTWLKMDLGLGLVEKMPGTVTHPLGSTQDYFFEFGHMGGWELTDKGVAMLSDFVAQVREAIGMEIPLCADHFGHIGVNSCLRLGKGLEKHNLAWLEDMVPWMYTDLLKQISDAVDIPLATGEDIYLKEPFRVLCEKHAVDIIHPDISCAGGTLETKKIGDMAEEFGVPMVLHSGATPVGHMAAVHCAAATQNFLALEHHHIDDAWWEEMVRRPARPIVDRGFVKVPEAPGLGVELNEEVVRQLVKRGGYFEPTPVGQRAVPRPAVELMEAATTMRGARSIACRIAVPAFLAVGLALSQPGARPLFNGRNLEGWTWSVEKRPPQPSWAAGQGTLRTTPGRGQEVYLLTRDSFADFDLSFEWNGEPGCNSGVKYRFQGYWVNGELRQAPEGPGRIEPVALEYQIADDEHNPDALSDAKHSTAAVYEYWPPEKPGPAKAGVWHSGRIVARGLHIEHWLDGRKVVDISLDSPEVQEAFSKSPRRGSSPALARHLRRNSPIALQMHDGTVKFRNLRIRPL
jgi:L-alanine-DL-glutamate epimerase-like enolase superfamily enzyme